MQQIKQESPSSNVSTGRGGFFLVLLVVFPILGVVGLLVLCCILVRCRCVFVSSVGVLQVSALGCPFFLVLIGGFRGAGRLVRFGVFPGSAVSYASSDLCRLDP